jgi:hypothetical protein
MTTKPGVRFTIQTDDGVSRTLVSVSEKRKDGTLTIRLKSDQLRRLPGLGASLTGTGPRLMSQKYSIHASTQSKRNINYIHHTMIYEDGSENSKEAETAHVTEAIKTNNGNFAMLYCRRCPDLRSDIFKSQGPTAEEVSLGSIDSEHFTLIYSLIATHPDNTFDPSDLPDINVIERRFSRVKLILLWTFVSLPSHRTSLTGHYRTIDPKDVTAPLDPGLTKTQAIARFMRERDVLEKELRDFHLEETIGFAWGSRLMVPIIRFFKEGNEPTELSRRYMQGMSERVLDLSPVRKRPTGE